MRCERIARVVPPPRVVPRPLARAPNLSLSTRAFSDRARGARRASNHITVRPVRARTRPSRAIESRATHSLYFFHARHRAESPSSRDAPFSSPPDDDRTSDPRRVSRNAPPRIIDRSIAGRRDARESLALSRAETNASRSSLSRGEFAVLGLRPGVAHSRARAAPRPTRARAAPREAPTATDRPTRPTRPTGWVVVDGMDTFLGHDPSFEGGHEIFSSARSSAQSCGRSVVIGES